MESSGSLHFWTSITRTLPKIGFCSTVITGSILLTLNFFGAQRHFGNYKFLMSIFTILGIVFAAVELLVYPNIHNFKASLIFFSFEESFGMHTPWSRNIPIASYTFFHAGIMSLLSVQFIYRYWAIFDTNKLRYFKGFRSLVWVAYCSLFACQYSVLSFYFFERDEISDKYLQQEMLICYNVKVSSIPAVAILAYDPNDGSVRWSSIIGILNASFMVNFQYGVMVYCGWSMHCQMEEKIKIFSETLKKHHKQFFKTLVLQITMPTIVLFIPITVIMVLPVFNFNISFPSGALLCCFTLYPAIDSLIIMYVVSEYKATAKRIRVAFAQSFQKMHSVRIGAISGTDSLANLA